MTNRIRQLREEVHMTQVRLSMELEVSQETVSAYENQKHYPSFTQLCKLSELFHVSIDYIMGLSEIRSPARTTDNETMEKVIAIGRKLSDPQLQLVLAYAQGILDNSALTNVSPL